MEFKERTKVYRRYFSLKQNYSTLTINGANLLVSHAPQSKLYAFLGNKVAWRRLVRCGTRLTYMTDLILALHCFNKQYFILQATNLNKASG